MAKLKMAPYPEVGEPKLPVLKRNLQAPNLSKLEMLRIEYQEKAHREKEEKLLTLFSKQQEYASQRVHGLSLHTAELLQKNNGTEQKNYHMLKYPPSLHTTPWAAEEKSWASNWIVSKRSAGVDRAHPLKPVVYRKVQENIASNANHYRSPSATATELKHNVLHPGHIRSKSSPSRPELFLQLQKTEYNLEAEIRKKEQLLKEKLRKAEEELRRIQKEKETAEMEDRSYKEFADRKTSGKSDEKSWNPSNNLDFKLERKKNNNFMKQGDMVTHQETLKLSKTISRERSPNPAVAQQYATKKLQMGQQTFSNEGRESSTETPPSSKREDDSYGDMTVRSHHALRNERSESTFDNKKGQEHILMDSTVELDGVELVPCQTCGRQFAAHRLQKHVLVCEKMQNSKRKVFDSSKARAKGTELEQYLTTNRRKQTHEPKVQSNTWQQKHKSFLQTIRHAREVQRVIAKGGKLSDLPPPPPEENPDYIACPHCSRRFAPRVAERHIPKCENIKSKPRPPPVRRR